MTEHLAVESVDVAFLGARSVHLQLLVKADRASESIAEVHETAARIVRVIEGEQLKQTLANLESHWQEYVLAAKTRQAREYAAMLEYRERLTIAADLFAIGDRLRDNHMPWTAERVELIADTLAVLLDPAEIERGLRQ